MKVLILLLAIVSIQAQAKINYARGEWGSGGGNALVCFAKVTEITNGEVKERDLVAEVKANNNTIPNELLQWIDTIELFDLYEAKKRRGLDSKKPEIIKIKDNEKIYEYFDRLGKRFEKNVYVMKGFIDFGKKLIPDTNLIFHESAVKYQNDLGSVTLPGPNCLISTIAAQVNFNDYFEVHIDERLFNHPKHTKQSKATLILHELIYALGRKELGHKDSGATRNVVRYFISYHETFTEGVVAKALHDLGFYKKDPEVPDLMAKYHYSYIMTIISLNLETFNDSVMVSLDSEYNQYLTQELRDKAVKQFQNEGFGDGSTYTVDFFGLEQLIEDGYRKSTSKNIWNTFSNELSQILKNLQKYIEMDKVTFKTVILEQLDSESKITKIDRQNSVGHIDFFLEDYDLTNGLISFKDIFEERDTYKEVMNEIYKSFIHFTHCTGSVDDVQDVPNTESETCYTPLLLNNIIPKQ